MPTVATDNEVRQAIGEEELAKLLEAASQPQSIQPLTVQPVLTLVAPPSLCGERQPDGDGCLGPLPTIHPRELEVTEAEMRLQKALAGLTRAEQVLVLGRSMLHIGQGAVSQEREPPK